MTDSFKELSWLIYAVRRACPRLPLLGASVVHPRHPVPAIHMEMITAIEKQGREETRRVSGELGGPRRMPSLFSIAKIGMRALFSALRETIAVMYLRLRMRLLVTQVRRQPATVVMKTWCFGPESLDGPADFYYGMLPALLEQRGVSSLLLCGNLGGGPEGAFSRAVLTRKHIRSIPERLLVPLWAPLLTACQQILTSLELRRLARNTSDRKFALACTYASLDCLRPATTQNTLYFYIARAAVRAWRPRIFMTLYEGQPWEQLAWHGVKAAGGDCLTVGYQHTVIMPHSFSLISPNSDSWELSTPDIVLCLGETTAKMMKPGQEPHGTRLVPFGSFRRTSTSSLRCPPKPERRTVLVLPEGVQSEAKVLFDFAMRAAPSLADYHFIFRCHPVLPFDRMRQHLEAVPEKFPNIEISNLPSIEDDFDRSSAVLYRGSSSVLYAILHGLKPIYLHSQNHPDVDPLFDLDGWRERVRAEHDLADVLRPYTAAMDDRIGEQWRAAAEYVSEYTRPVDGASIDRFLGAVGLLDGAGGR